MLKRRFRFQFSLGGVLVLMTVLGVVAAIVPRYLAYQRLHGLLMQHARFMHPSPGAVSLQNYFAGKVYDIEHLSFQDHTLLDDEVFASFSPLRNVRRLSLQGTSVSDDCIQTLQLYPGLRVLSVTDTRVTDQFVASLDKFPALRELHLGETRISRPRLDQLHHVRTLNLNRTGLRSPAYHAIAKMTNLERLELHQPELTAKDIVDLQKASQLAHLELLRIDEAMAGEVARLPHIETLIAVAGGSRVDLNRLTPMDNLRRLELKLLTKTNGVAWSKFANLESLDLRSESEVSITDQPTLRNVTVRFRRLRKDLWIKDLPNLRSLDIQQECSSATNTQARVILKDLPKLKTLRVTCCSVTINDSPGIKDLEINGEGHPGSHSFDGTLTLDVRQKLNLRKSSIRRVIMLEMTRRNVGKSEIAP